MHRGSDDNILVHILLNLKRLAMSFFRLGALLTNPYADSVLQFGIGAKIEKCYSRFVEGRHFLYIIYFLNLQYSPDS